MTTWGVLQVGGPYYIKTLIVTETRSVDNETTLTGGVTAGAAMMLWGQSQPEARRLIGLIVAPMRQTIIGCWNVRWKSWEVGGLMRLLTGAMRQQSVPVENFSK